MKKITIVVLFSFLFINCYSQSKVNFNSGWEFLYKGKYYPATVPGTIHTDLLNNKLIEDPFYRDNENKLQWIEDLDWVYKKVFYFDSASAVHQDLVFEGLDTYADVFLNGKVVLSANNMFRTWRIDLVRYCMNGNNEIKIIFHSVVKKGKELSAQLPYSLPGSEYVFIRKAAYQFGWDFAPRFVTCGIWKDVFIEEWENVKLENIYVQTLKISGDSAIIKVSVNYKGTPFGFQGIFLKLYLNTNAGLIQLNNNANFISSEYDSTKKYISWVYSISHPILWETSGNSTNYFAAINLVIPGRITIDNPIDHKHVTDSIYTYFSIREIKLIQNSDSVSAGKSFYFEINGKPTYMKGANFVPPDMFLPRVSHDSYRHLLTSAKVAHMNMIRVWGGGTYADDYFYDLCDSLGILVWQDFMFACAMYPGDAAFLENVRQEAIDNIIRLRNHPCIALWCGNNEINEGWQNWSWQKQFNYSATDSIKIWNDYKNLFEKTLPDIVHQYDSTTSYWPSSPSIGWGHPESLQEGDSHYWGVWWGQEPFNSYYSHVGRFVSEFGFQSMPTMSTIEKFTLPEDRNISSSIILAHQKNSGGFEKLNAYMKMYNMKPKTFSDYVKASQQLQSDAMITAVTAHVNKKPWCMGTLIWQLNDCWPGASWSLIDYYGEWKPVMWEMEKLFK